jgi:hypothetical protein
MLQLDPVLNELSLQPPVAAVYAARQGMDSLVRTVIAASRHGATRTIRSHVDLNDMMLADGYTVRQWRNDGEVDRELRTYFRSVASKAPYLADLPDQSVAAEAVDCFYEELPAVGLRAAFVIDSLALSLPAGQHWDSAEVAITIRDLDESTGDLRDTTASVRHASRPDHIVAHAPWIKRRVQPEISSGESLWQERERRYPALTFCANVKSQLEDIQGGDAKLPQILRFLDYLEEYAASWTAGRFDADQLRGSPSPESAQTLQQFANERTFHCPDGQERLFNWHLKLKDYNWRIHFFPDEARKQIIVGYIGHHLPTVKYRT